MRVGAAPVPIPADRMLVIGRQEDCDLSVPSGRISRRHAEIGFLPDKRLVVRDLGSQNGTQVNGKRITEHALEDGDEITVGPFLCTYRKTSGAAPAAAPDQNALTQPMVSDAMAGRLDQMSLFELLQTLEFNRKSGTLEVFGTDDADGRLVLQEGSPIFAECDGAPAGEEAIYRLLAQKSGQFSFSADLDASERNVSRPMTSILLEAGRRMDEGGG